MGNPSDGFYGKTIALSIDNFWAEVTISGTVSASRLSIHTDMFYVQPGINVIARFFLSKMIELGGTVSHFPFFLYLVA